MKRRAGERAFCAVGMLLIMLIACGYTFALDPNLDVSQYAHTSWRIRDGFTKGIITSLAQTPDGYLWLGTELGLFRFDGVRPAPWFPPPGQELPGNLITDLVTAHDGTLWIGTFTGLATWKEGKLTQFSELSGQNIQSVLETQDGTVWIGTYGASGGSLCSIQRGHARCETLTAGIEALYEDSKGTLWVGLQNGFWRWKPGSAEFFSVPGDPIGITSFAEDQQGRLLFGSYAGIRRFMNGRIEPYPSSAPVCRWPVERMFRDRDGTLWVGTSEHGIIQIHGNGRTDVFSRLDGLSGDLVRRFLEDREGSIWVSTFDGLDRFREYAVPTISTTQGLSNATAVALLAARDDSVWISTLGGLNHWKDGTFSLVGSYARTQKAGGTPDGKQPIGPLFQDSVGQIWVSTYEGFGYLQRGKYIRVISIPSLTPRAIGENPRGHLWVTTQLGGLFHVFRGHVLQQIPWAVLGGNDFAQVLAADPSHHGLWLGFHQGGVAYFNDGAVRASYSVENGLGKGTVSDLRFGTGEALWAATAGGLSRIKDGHVTTLTSKNGLPCDKVVASVEDNDYSMWLNLACGLARITHADLDAWIADPHGVIKSTFFDTSDGVRTHAANGGYQPLMTKSADGKIWFLPWDGVSVIDPHHLSFNKVPPPVHIEQVIADRKTYNVPPDFGGALRLPPRVRDLQIDYTALSLAAPEKVLFRYKMEGWDRDWQDAGTRRQAFYSNLPPRSYTFRVKACNNSGVWNEAGTSLAFSIAPAYHQTWWFRSLFVVVFLTLLFAAHRLRLHEVEQQFNLRLEGRVAERTRIARELHDTLLQSFQGVLLRLHAVTYMLGDRPEARKTLSNVIEQARQAITEGRDSVQGLRSGLVGNDIAQALSMFGENLVSDQNDLPRPDFHVQVEGTPRDLSPILRDDIYQIACEALLNSFQHARAGRIEVEIRYDQRELRLRVRDDGKGIDSKVLSAGGRVGHYGFPGMHERAKLVGGKLAIWSEIDSGTEAELTIPASVVYAKQKSERRPTFGAKGA